MSDAGRPLKFNSVKELDDAIEAYFNDLQNTRKTLSGLAVFLGCDRKTLYNYKERDEFFPSIKKALAFMETIYEEKMIYDGSPTGVIFALKNFGWSDKTETDITTGGEKINLPPINWVKSQPDND